MNKKLQGLEKNINELQGQKKRHAKRHLLTSEDSTREDESTGNRCKTRDR